MASTYPGAVDGLVRPDSTDPLSDGHAALHNATSDAVEAVQTELGVNPSGSEATVAARLTAAESATSAAQATATAAVPKATYDAHTVLAATTDNTPAAVTVAEQTIVGRKTGGNITALTAAETKTLLGLGTAAVVDVPPSGDATSGQVVKGSDSRLSDARTPTAHKTSHQSGGGDELTLAQAQITNLTSDLSAKAPLASPTFTGVPTAPTAAVDTNTTQVATTAFTVAQGYAKIATEGWVSPIRTSGGYTAKTALYTATNDDRVIDCTSGTYTITLPTAVSQAGREFVVTNSGSGVITVDGAGAETVAGAATQSVSGRGHLRIVSDGSNWVVLDGSYTDESVGRRLFQWDANNSRWQMTYGDTGWRDVSAGLEAGTTGEWRMRRVNSTVTHHVYNVTNSSGVMYTIPAGFRTVSYGTVIPLTKWDLTAGAVLLNSPAAGNCTLSDGLKGYTGAYYMFTHDTSDAWPTTLPGSAVGSIPA